MKAVFPSNMIRSTVIRSAVIRSAVIALVSGRYSAVSGLEG